MGNKVGRGHIFPVPTEAIAMYESGMSCREIGNAIGCTYSTVNVHLKSMGVRMRNHKQVGGWRQSEESNQKRALAHNALWDARGRVEGNWLRTNAPWRTQRNACYERDRWRCGRCRKKCLTVKEAKRVGNHKLVIQAHHIIPRREGGSDDLSNLVTLCMSCHHKIERKPRLSDGNNCSEFSFKVKEEQTHGIIEGVTG